MQGQKDQHLSQAENKNHRNSQLCKKNEWKGTSFAWKGPKDLTCHHLGTIRQEKRQRRSAKRWRDDLDKYWNDTIRQRTAQYRLTCMRLSGGIDVTTKDGGVNGFANGLKRHPSLDWKCTAVCVCVFLIHRIFRCTILSPYLGILPIHSVVPRVSCSAFLFRGVDGHNNVRQWPRTVELCLPVCYAFTTRRRTIASSRGLYALLQQWPRLIAIPGWVHFAFILCSWHFAHKHTRSSWNIHPIRATYGGNWTIR